MLVRAARNWWKRVRRVDRTALLGAYLSGDTAMLAAQVNAFSLRYPKDAWAYACRATLLEAAGEARAAQSAYEEAILADFSCDIAYAGLARMLASAGDTTAARRIIELARRQGVVVDRVIADVLLLESKSADPASLYAFALQFLEESTHENRGLGERLLASSVEIHIARGDFGTATLQLAHLEKVTGNTVVVSGLRAAVALESGDVGVALAHLRKGVDDFPADPTFHFNLAVLADDCGNMALAHEHVGAALQIAPEFPRAHALVAALLMREGQFVQSFLAYEKRPVPVLGTLSTAKINRWDGSPLRDKRILIVDEQGLGDSIMFYRFVKPFVSMALEHGCAEIAYLCWSPLYPLYAADPALRCVRMYASMDEALTGTPEGQNISAKGSASAYANSPFDYYVFQHSLPHYLEIASVLPALGFPYIAIGSEARAQWCEKIRSRRSRYDSSKGRPMIGIAWEVNLEGPVAKRRRVPLESLIPLLVGTQFEWVNLHVLEHQCETFSQIVPDGVSFEPPFIDFVDTGAAILALDAVVTSDTAVAHVAGALGIQTAVLLPVSGDWRWSGPNPQESYWYPSVRLFRQKILGDWAALLPEVEEWLRRVRSETQKTKRPSCDGQ